MNTTYKIILLVSFQFIVFSIFGQKHKLYNYANLNTTSISAEFLDQQMILETVDENLDWDGSWRENNWYIFEFNQEIEISQLRIGFYENTCLDKCKLEFQLITNDTIIEIAIDSIISNNELEITCDKLIINRKDVYPRGPGHINEIEIISKTKPLKEKNGNPIILLNKNKRLEIKYLLIDGLEQKQIEILNKTWKARKKFYNNHIKYLLEPHEKRFFEQSIFYGNDEKWYCYKVDFYTNHLNNKNLKELFDKCDCDIRELFFERKMNPTEKMNYEEFNFLGDTLSYRMDSTERVLIEYMDGGDAWAGHAVPHICLMGKYKYINKIDSLQFDSNVFTQVQAIKGLIYFNEYKRAQNIANNIFQKELKSIEIDSISIYGYYACGALRIMNEYYPNENLPRLLKLYKGYRNLYPEDMNNYDSWTSAYNYGNVIGKRIESFQGCDRSILGYVEDYLNRFPHLITNPTIMKFKEYIDEKAVHNNRYHSISH